MTQKQNNSFKCLKKCIKTKRRVSNLEASINCDIKPKGFLINVINNMDLFLRAYK